MKQSNAQDTAEAYRKVKFVLERQTVQKDARINTLVNLCFYSWIVYSCALEKHGYKKQKARIVCFQNCVHFCGTFQISEKISDVTTAKATVSLEGTVHSI